MHQIFENNKVSISGLICIEPTFSHEVYGEKFYDLSLVAQRLSENTDIIPITISERLVSISELIEGRTVSVTGQYRSYNKFDGERSKLILSVFVREILLDFKYENPNEIYIDGYICKEPILRTTPFSREICDMLIAVNRAYNKSDYIPAIAWGRNAKYISTLKIGDNVRVSGRIQSREYVKTISGEQISKTAYEVSIGKIIDTEEVSEYNLEVNEEIIG